MFKKGIKLAVVFVIALSLLIGMIPQSSNQVYAATNITTKEWDNLTGWNTAGDASVSNSILTLQSSSGSVSNVHKLNFSIPQTYQLTFRAKVEDYGNNGATLGIKVVDGKYRLMFKREDDGFYAITMDSEGTWKKIASGTASTAWTEFRIDVSNGEACFQYRHDGTNWSRWYTFSLAENPNEDRLEHWTDSDSSTVKFDWTKMIQEDYTAANGPYVFHRTYEVVNAGDQNVADFVVIPGTPRKIKSLFKNALSNGTDLMYWTESTDDGFTWSNAVLADFEGEDNISSNIFRTDQGTILRLRKSEFTDSPTEIWFERSTDNGASFSGHVTLGYKINPMPGKIMQTSTGRIFIATASGNGGGDGDEGARIYYSDDDGLTWTKTYHFNATQMTLSFGEVDLIELPNGNIRAYGRTTSGYLYTSVSTDADTVIGDSTWSAPVASSLKSPNNSFALDEDPYNRGTYYMVWTYNNEGGSEWANRNNIALAKSTDGINWSWVDFISRMPITNPEGWFKYNNTSMEITPTALLISSQRDEDNTSAKDFKMHLWRVNKGDIVTKDSFPPVPNP